MKYQAIQKLKSRAVEDLTHSAGLTLPRSTLLPRRSQTKAGHASTLPRYGPPQSSLVKPGKAKKIKFSSHDSPPACFDASRSTLHVRVSAASALRMFLLPWKFRFYFRAHSKGKLNQIKPN